MSEALYKVLYSGGAMLSIHFDSIEEACKSAKEAIYQGYTDARVVCRGSEITLVQLSRLKVTFPDLTETIDGCQEAYNSRAYYYRKSGKYSFAESMFLKGKTIGITLMYLQDICKSILG